jgi:hypothetical protein
MYKKTKDIQNFISNVGKTEQLHLFVGTTDSTIENNTEEAAKELWRNMVFSKRMSKEDVVGIIPNITWNSGNVYVAWSANKANTGAFYAWNKENGNVYLCLGNNEFNRDDLSGTIASTYAPNHAGGIQKYADGYTWLPIYRITGDFLRFVKTEWIPVVSFEDYEPVSFSTEFLAADDFCEGEFNNSGNCSVYLKQNYEFPINGVSFDYYEKGALYKTITTDCSECYFMFKENEIFKSVFKLSQSDIASSIPVYTKLETIGLDISNNRLPASSAYYALYQISENGPDDGSVISASIDLSSFDPDDLIMNFENPVLTVSSYSGSGASIRLKTYLNIDGKYILNGIEVVSNGTGYRDIELDIDSSVFVTTSIKDFVIASININLDLIDGLNVDPYDVLNAEHIMVDARIDTNELQAQKIELPPTVNLFGLITNPIERTDSGDLIISGSELPPNATKVNSGLTEIGVVFEDDIGGFDVTKLPQLGSSFAKTATGTPVSNTKILKSSLGTLEPVPSLPNESFINVVGYNYSKIVSTSSIEDLDGENFIVNQVIKKPKFEQYSGKILQSTKTTTNLNVASSTTNPTRIIRINIIKGL